jgi:hypothetical protein
MSLWSRITNVLRAEFAWLDALKRIAVPSGIGPGTYYDRRIHSKTTSKVNVLNEGHCKHCYKYL